ncbi:MAG: DUF4199 domain-containing protein [Opitutaceae bacterium]
MKTYLTYGAAMAIAGVLLNLVLYFAGFHSDASKLGTAQLIGGLAGIGIAIACIVLGTRARRAEVLATNEDFGYGRALGAGVMITLFSALCGMVTSYLYMNVINPDFTEVMIQNQVQKMEASGVGGDKIEQMETVTRKMMNPAIMTAMGFIGAMFSGTLISLISAAFLKRQASDGPPLIP